MNVNYCSKLTRCKYSLGFRWKAYKLKYKYTQLTTDITDT
jgi:hypothetical protein